MNMLSKTLLFTAGLFVLAVVATNVRANPLEDQVRAPAVRLDAYCTGQVVWSKRDDKTGKVATYVLTAKHCVKDDTDKTIPIAVDRYDGLKKTGKIIYDAKVLGTSYKSDLGLLKLKDEQTFFTNVSDVAKNDINLQFGQDVVVEGYPVGMSKTETEGKLGYLEEQPAFGDLSTSKTFYRATPDTVGGSSGSAMYTLDSDGKYKLIGILTGGYQNATYINYYTPIDEINAYLDVAIPGRTDTKTVVSPKGN